jgi:CheY-like chemotaxis protein/HPt (histidine-containing phosphotransfer) domain-containing protein
MKTDDIFFDYTSDVVSAVIPKNVDRSKVLDILISVFSVEEHQRQRDTNHISGMTKKLSDEYPAKILIAEDNLINQKLAQNIFEGIGYSPVIVSNGLQVIDQLKKQNFDIIFMDVQMPEMDGFETTRFIRHKLQPEVRPSIIAMTAFALEGDKEKCIEAGMDDYISKPFLIEEIAEKIRKWAKVNGVLSAKKSSEEKMNTITKQVININALNRLKEMTGEADASFFKKVLNMFIEQGEEQIVEIKAALAAGRVTELGSQAHKLKGSALNIGAEELAETCRQMELKGRDNDGSGMKELVEKLIGDFAASKKVLADYL